MKIYLLAGGVVVGAGSLVMGLWRDPATTPRATDPTRSVHVVSRGTLRVTVGEEGTVQARKTQKVSHKLDGQGTVTFVVAEGATVAAAEVVVRLEDKQIKQELDSAGRAVESAKAKVEVAREGIEVMKAEQTTEAEKQVLALEAARLELTKYSQGEAALQERELKLAVARGKAKLEQARERHAAMPRLLEEGFVTRVKVEEARIAVAEAEVELESAELKLRNFERYEHPAALKQKESAVKEAETAVEQTKLRHASALRQKEAELLDAENELKQNEENKKNAEEKLEKTVLKAPCAGVVHYGDPDWWGVQDLRVGVEVWQGQTMLNIPDLSELYVVLQIPEVDVPRLSPGQPATVTFKSLPGVGLPGKVDKIGQVADRRSRGSGAKKFRVEVALTQGHPQLKPGLSARCEVEVQTLPDVVSVPSPAVVLDGDKSLVHVGSPEGFSARPIEVGIRTATHVQVVSGVQPGESVLLYDPRPEKPKNGP